MGRLLVRMLLCCQMHYSQWVSQKAPQKKLGRLLQCTREKENDEIETKAKFANLMA